MSKKLIDGICFYFDGVLKRYTIVGPVPHAIPMLYRQFGKYEKVFIYDPNRKPEEIREWISHHDMQWRQCCDLIIHDPEEEEDDKRSARFTLNAGPLAARIHFPDKEPRCSVYVMKHVDNEIKVTSVLPMEVYKEW